MRRGWWLRVAASWWLLAVSAGENRAPSFLPGGDMARFSLLEGTQPGTPLYRLQGSDPEGGKLSYSISGEELRVDRETGLVTLARSVDRELTPIIETVISITDEAEEGGGDEPNTVSVRREIPVLDVNDNPPEFSGRPYAALVSESTPLGTVIFSRIHLTDRDAGINAELSLACISPSCDKFNVTTERLGEGEYRGVVSLREQLDFETSSSYSLTLEARDLSPEAPLSATANLAVSVRDVQDQPPVFLNAPYSATLQENTSPGFQVLQIKAKDGDFGDPRPVVLSLEGDTLGYFKLVKNTLVTSSVPIDREHPEILQNGGVYTFNVKATELINNELPGDFSLERVTIVITDVDDQIPKFNEPVFHINVSEDIAIGTPLPGLNLVVVDEDLGENSHFNLGLRSSDRRVSDWFSVEPSVAFGRTPVVIRLRSNSGFDYDQGLRQIKFTVLAYVHTTQGEAVEVSSSEVVVHLVDANDNSPVFSRSSYSFRIPEDSPPGTKVANLTATDADSGDFANITYSLRGFGTDKFRTDPEKGDLYLTGKVDYEQQKSYSLSLEAKDGGGRLSTVSVLVGLSDVNDNPPHWELPQYQRTVREGATLFQPQFFIRAMDLDKDGESVLTYKLLSSNSEVLSVDYRSGEVKINTPVSSSHTSRGQYEMVVRAFDDGSPPLHSDVEVLVRVGVPGNQRPVFRGVPYNVSLPETATPGTQVLTVRATDPDGPDSAILYKIANSADNFQIDESSGRISVSDAALLDPEVTGSRRYSVIVLALDSGGPVRETAQTTVTVNILDLNNKPPVFPSSANYVRHISERTSIGKSVLTVEAHDPDLDAELEYRISNVRAVDRSGIVLTRPHHYDFLNAFKIDPKSGDITVNSQLSHHSAAVIILTIEAVDKNATINSEAQIARVEVTVYIEAYNELNPKFTLPGWSPLEPRVEVKVQEERPLGSALLTLAALDPTDNSPIARFTLLPPLPGLVGLDTTSGVISVLRRIDYEFLEEKVISFRVEASSHDNLRKSEAHIVMIVEDINDHTPEFERSVYQTKVIESAYKDSLVVQVRATDGDAANTSLGYGDIRYSLSGENADLFIINATSGEIKVAGVIDREKESVLRLVVTAADTPQGGLAQRKAHANVVVEVEDLNDNAPQFSLPEYSGVVLENVPRGSSVLNLSATDLDTGPGGRLSYLILPSSHPQGLFSINEVTGEVVTGKALTGKGRTEPYHLTVRAQDAGNPSLFTDVPLKIFIGDVVSNDGVPTFIHPTLNEMAYISENSSVGAPVFRAVATDPDDPNSPEGQIKYSLLEDGADSLAFRIGRPIDLGVWLEVGGGSALPTSSDGNYRDALTGLITTRESLDRETKSDYTLILVARDSGLVPQQDSRQLRVRVTDIDDNKPHFKRSKDDPPLELSVNEEIPLNSTIGLIEAVDLDVGENANIGYLITDGNDDGLFGLVRLENNSALLLSSGRLDREQAGSHLLTVKCFKLSSAPSPPSLRKLFNKEDLSELQIRINVMDIDDNLPRFVNNNITVGVRMTVSPETVVASLSAVDEDSDAEPISYSLESVEFSLPGGAVAAVPRRHHQPPPRPPAAPGASLSSLLLGLFTLDNSTGELRTAASLAGYYDGLFELRVSASNRASSPERSWATVKVFVVRDRGLMKFVFSQPPSEVRANLERFKSEVEQALALPAPASLNVYDTQFLAKTDGSLDFSSTSSCFQLVGSQMYDVKEMERLLLPANNPAIAEVYQKHGVLGVERCAQILSKAEISWVQLCLLGIATFIGVASFISGCVLCCSYKKWQRIR